MKSDWDLLRQFARENSQDAFGEIVRRHLNLVYSAALRQARSPQLAEEIAQSVFADLARNAGKLKPDAILTAWLYAVTRRTAIDVIRKESRRHLREQIATEMNNMNATGSSAGVPPAWSEIEPLLDDAMAALEEADRSAVLLRYFENKSLREVGESLSASEDAAQKRVSRAVERLREFFSKRNIIVGAGGLAVLISANAVQSAPVGLSATISTGVASAATTIGITLIYKLLIAGLTAATVGIGFYAVHLQKQRDLLQQQQAPWAEQIRQLQRERDEATNALAVVEAENLQLQSDQSEVELLRLRDEVTRLQNQANHPTETTTAASKWMNWNNDQSIGSFYAVAGTATETVAVGVDGRIATRNNTTGTWNIQTFTGDPDFRAIIYADNQYVVVREAGFIMTSPDGIRWTRRTSPTRENLLGLFWDGHQYLAGGDKGTILSSPDGSDWTRHDSGSRINFCGFSYSGSRYVAVGNDGILVSNDSVTWTSPRRAPKVPFTACTWTGSEFLACGLGLDKNPTIYTSPDGEFWTLRDTTITASLRTVVTLNGAIYVSGDSVIEKSTDGGTTWTNTFTKSKRNNLFMGLASNGDFLIAVGFNNNVWAMPVSDP
ncbi:MAG TPA: sigma-70 family RNA polymerase sigma factor [Candidatus Sulfopaludibacter sp.]|nr:sigma-70 family RNA polymerase sigma factor [Candidatus Sulfopaludibacter sp.]